MKEASLKHNAEALARYKMVLETIDEGFSIIDVLFDEKGEPYDYRFLDTNSNFEHQTGLSNVSGKTARETIPGLEKHWFELYGAVAKTGEPARFSQGSEVMGRWFDVQASKIGDKEGHLVSLIFKDVTDQKRRDLEQALLSKQLSDVLESTNDAFFMLDKDWKIVRVNKKYEESSRHTRDESVGRNFWELYPSFNNKTSQYYIMYHQVMKTRKHASFTDYCEPLKMWTEVDVYPSGQGAISVFSRDITEAKRTEQDLRDQVNYVETITNNTIGSLCVIDNHGLIVYMNPAAVKTTGHAQRDVLGKSFHALMHHSHPDGTPYPEEDCPLRKAYVSERALPETETTFFRKDGEPFPVRIASTPISGEGNHGNIVEFRDISEFQEARTEVQRAKRRYDALFNSNTVALATANMNGDVLEANDNFLKMFGYTKADLKKGLNSRDVTAPSDVNGKKMFAAIASDGESLPIERRYVRKNGDEFPALVGSVNLPGDTERFVSFIIDTSENEQLKELNRTKDEFIALASHQLRTPATAVKQYLGIVMEEYAGPVTADQLQYLNIANNANDRQLMIIEDLLKTARIDTRGFGLTLKPHDFTALVLDAIRQYKPMVETKNQTLSFVGGGKKAIVPLDATEMSVCIANLIENASKYSPSKTTISLELAQTDTYVELRVKDRGVGIDEKDLEKVFEKFTRVHNELSDTASGSGLGLYWVKRIIDIHKGSLTIDSKVGEGSTFAIRLKK